MVDNIFEIKDERFDIDKIQDFDLVLELKNNRFRFTLIETKSKTVFWLEDHHIDSDIDFEIQVKDIYSNHLFLRAQYWNSITFCLESEYFSLVPISVFQETEIENYLIEKKNLRLKENFLLDYRNIPKLKIVLAYAIQKQKIEFIKSLYPEVGLSIFTDVEVQLSKLKIQPFQVNIWFNSDSTLVSFFNKKAFEGTYRIPLQEDILDQFLNYFFSKNKKDYKVNLYGEVTIFSPWYKFFSEYFLNFTIDEPIFNLKFSQYFQNIPLHRYICLFSSFSLKNEGEIRSID